MLAVICFIADWWGQKCVGQTVKFLLLQVNFLHRTPANIRMFLKTGREAFNNTTQTQLWLSLVQKQHNTWAGSERQLENISYATLAAETSRNSRPA